MAHRAPVRRENRITTSIGNFEARQTYNQVRYLAAGRLGCSLTLNQKQATSHGRGVRGAVPGPCWAAGQSNRRPSTGPPPPRRAGPTGTPGCAGPEGAGPGGVVGHRTVGEAGGGASTGSDSMQSWEAARLGISGGVGVVCRKIFGDKDSGGDKFGSAKKKKTPRTQQFSQFLSLP